MADSQFDNRLKELAGVTLPKGNYTLLELIASSHMSVVYKALDNASNRTVAVKILADDKYLWRFKAEAELGYLLNIANVASTIRAEMNGELLPNGLNAKYLVMKWISGKSLGDVIRANRMYPLSTPKLLEFTVSLLQKITPALERIHAANIVHRDIKPNNIRFNNDAIDHEEPYLLDFGIAKWVQVQKADAPPTNDAEKTRVWEAPGTHKYMPPEQWDGEAIPRSDEYSLALLVYEVLSDGYSPFENAITSAPVTGSSTGTEGRRRYDWERVHREGQPLPLQEYRPDIPQAVWQVILRALNKNHLMRYETVTKFTEAFIKAVNEPTAPVAPAPEVQKTMRQDLRELTPPAAPAPKPPTPAPAAPASGGDSFDNQPTMRMPLPSKTVQQPIDEVLRQATAAVPVPKPPDNRTPIPPIQRAVLPPEPASSGRSVLPYAIGGLLIGLLILGALFVLPGLNAPTVPTATATDLYAALAATLSPSAPIGEVTDEATAAVVEVTATEVPAEPTATLTDISPTDEPTEVPATATDVPATATDEPTVEVLVLSATDTPTDQPTDVPPTATDEPTDVPATATTVPATATKTVTRTPTTAASNTPTVAPTKTATVTPRPSATATRTLSPTATATHTPSATPTFTPSPTATATVTPSPTATFTATPLPFNALDLLTQMRDAGRRANQFNCAAYIEAYDGLAQGVSDVPEDAAVTIIEPLLSDDNDPVTVLYDFCKLPANENQERVLLRSNLANNQYRLWGSLMSDAIADVRAISS